MEGVAYMYFLLSVDLFYEGWNVPQKIISSFLETETDQ